MDDERAEIIERLCQSAAPDALFPRCVGFIDEEIAAHRIAERKDRIDLFKAYTVHLGPHFDRNTIEFPDLYGEWVYQPC